MVRIVIGALFFLHASGLAGQSLRPGTWRFTLSRSGGLPVYVMAEWKNTRGTSQLVFLNHTERIEIAETTWQNDSLHFSMPLFETSFHLEPSGDTLLTGIMTKGTSAGKQAWNVQARWGATQRIPEATGKAAINISGRWAVEFQRADGSWRPAVAEWTQTGNKLTGTIINPSGDYRFLEGEVWDRQLYVTAFDGAHIYAFHAEIPNDSTLANGRFFSGNPPGDAFRGKKDPDAKLQAPAPVAELKPGQNRLSFRFPDTDSNLVSITDARFQGKVVIVQLMGSWCPNCMDETKFLSEYYNAQKSKEVEMVSLAYELSTDFYRSARSLQKFRDRFGVVYPMLITGARSADPDKAAKTLPQLTDIKYFPTTLFLDKKGIVRKVHNGFYGPGAPEYFAAYKEEFYATIKQLTQE